MTKRVQLLISLLFSCLLSFSTYSLHAQNSSTATFKNIDSNATLVTGIVMDSRSQTIEAYGKRYLGEYTWGKRSLKKVYSTPTSTTYKVVYNQGAAQHTMYITQKDGSNALQVITETKYEGDRPEYTNVRNFELARISYHASDRNASFDGIGAANK